MTKKEAIAIMERAGYTYTGYNDIGWGMKYYCFTSPTNPYITYDLSGLRARARYLDTSMWLEAHRARLREGIQEELLTDTEIESHYAIVK